MNPDTILSLATAAVAEQSERTAALVRSLNHAQDPIPDSEWTVREAAVHLSIGNNLYAEIATGTPSPFVYESKAAWDPICASLNADIPETDPAKLADLMSDAAGRLLEAVAGRPGTQPVTWHSAVGLDLATLLCVQLYDWLLHGYDIARAVGRPWPIPAGQAALALAGSTQAFCICLNPATTAGHTAAYGIELRGGLGELTVRFIDGRYSVEPPGGSVDCTISADPVALLLVASGRMIQFEAIALGLLSTGGHRPELALGFTSLFIAP
jgi:uncharacterized protein (TIGR03083 family)